MKGEMLTTKEAQKVLEQRGINVAYSTIAYWVRTGKFKDAVQEETPRGAVWYIPKASLENFDQPEMGRPPKLRGFNFNINQISEDSYQVECYPRELQQSRNYNESPRPVPPYPIANVTVLSEEKVIILWETFPQRFEHLKNEIEESVKQEVLNKHFI